MVEIPEGPFEPTWESLRNYKVPDWYQDAKFGIFIHWGLYSVPAFEKEWYPHFMYKQGHPTFEYHLKTYGPQDKFGYKDFIPLFTAEKWDPFQWAKLFKEAGARYVVLVAEFHDGFALWDSARTRWNSVKMGPKRDIVGELAEAVRSEGLVFGVSYHRAENWWFFEGGKQFPSDVQDPQYRDLYGPAQPENTQPDETFLTEWLLRAFELVDKYRPQIFWFDWWIEQPAFEPYLRLFAAYYYNRAHQWDLGVVINYKHNAFPEGTAVLDVERGRLGRLSPFFWQTDTPVDRKSWCYIKDPNYKTPQHILQDLVDVVSKNGCYLLDFGPRPDGTFPEEQVRIMEEIGRWLKVNGEAIYGTRPWRIYGEGPTKEKVGEFVDNEPMPYTDKDIRFTRRGDILYALVLGEPKERIDIKALGTYIRLYEDEIGEVRLLEREEPLRWERTTEHLSIWLPQGAWDCYPLIFKITPKR